LIGRWDEQTITGNRNSYYFREDGTFLYSRVGIGYENIGSTGNRSGNYSVSNGWITFTNIVARDANGHIEEWPKTVRVEYSFDDPVYGYGEFLLIVPFDYNLEEIPLEGFWGRWKKMD